MRMLQRLVLASAIGAMLSTSGAASTPKQLEQIFDFVRIASTQ
jgi:hypothetical protein